MKIHRPAPLRLVLAGVLLVAGVGSSACTEEPAPLPVRPIRSLKLSDSVGFQKRRFPGRAKATLEVDLGFELNGKLVERSVNVGDLVEAGTLMARIDPREFDNGLLRAQAERDRAKAYFERVDAAYEKRAVSRQEVDDARARFNQAEATVAMRQKDVDDTRMIAPFDGVVSSTLVDNFQNVRAKQPVIRFLDVSQVEMVINIPEDLINLTQYVKDVRVRFDAISDGEARGTIKEIGSEASEATRTFPVTIIMDPKIGDMVIKPGMAGEVTAGKIEIPDHLAKSGIEVPATAIFSPDDAQPSKTFVWIVDEQAKTVHRREVTVVTLTERGGTLVKGVEPGDRVATAGVHYLREGQEVRFDMGATVDSGEVAGS